MERTMVRSLGCSFFKSWNHEMAYILGYWFADGNMYTQKSCGSYIVSIGSKDVEHLESLRNLIGIGKVTRITGSVRSITNNPEDVGAVRTISAMRKCKDFCGKRRKACDRASLSNEVWRARRDLN